MLGSKFKTNLLRLFKSGLSYDEKKILFCLFVFPTDFPDFPEEKQRIENQKFSKTGHSLALLRSTEECGVYFLLALDIENGLSKIGFFGKINSLI